MSDLVGNPMIGFFVMRYYDDRATLEKTCPDRSLVLIFKVPSLYPFSVAALPCLLDMVQNPDDKFSHNTGHT